MILIITIIAIIISSTIAYYIYFYKKEEPKPWEYIKPGTTVRCIKGKLGDLENPYALYKYVGDDQVSFYPTPEIAYSHDKNWGDAIPIEDCTGMSRIEDSELKEGLEYKHHTLSGCEASEAKLNCGSGIINSTKIKYGRWDNTICPHPTVDANTPPKSKEYIILEAIGKSEYSIRDKNSLKNINEDIYPNVYKHWEIEYSCT